MVIELLRFLTAQRISLESLKSRGQFKHAKIKLRTYGHTDPNTLNVLLLLS